MSISKDQFEELRDDFYKLMELYDAIKRTVKETNRHLYERWRAGGFIVDGDILSMYPSLEKVIEELEEECEEEECEEEEEFEEDE